MKNQLNEKIWFITDIESVNITPNEPWFIPQLKPMVKLKSQLGTELNLYRIKNIDFFINKIKEYQNITITTTVVTEDKHLMTLKELSEHCYF